LSCEQREGHRVCQTTFDPVDYRGPATLVEPGATERYAVPVTFWLPDDVVDPPLLVFGHGLGQRRADAEEIIEEGKNDAKDRNVEADSAAE
jgi:hypothetical protein